MLWSADAGEEQCVVKNVTNVKPKSYLPRSWTSLAVFNDAVALSEVICFHNIGKLLNKALYEDM